MLAMGVGAGVITAEAENFCVNLFHPYGSDVEPGKKTDSSSYPPVINDYYGM